MSDTTAPVKLGARARRSIVWVIIGSFSLAALAGISVLLGATLGDTAWRVLATTSTVGGFSILGLCCAALLGRRLQVFGIIGLGVVVITTVLVLALIWRPENSFWGDTYYRWLWTGVVFSAAWALVSLLLLASDVGSRLVQIFLWITVGLVVLLTALTLPGIWGVEDLGEWYTRLVGIVAILATLGSIVVPVMTLVLRGAARGRGASAPPSTLPASVVRTLVAEAARRGVSVEELVAMTFPAPPEQPVAAASAPPEQPVA